MSEVASVSPQRERKNLERSSSDQPFILDIKLATLLLSLSRSSGERSEGAPVLGNSLTASVRRLRPKAACNTLACLTSPETSSAPPSTAAACPAFHASALILAAAFHTNDAALAIHVDNALAACAPIPLTYA